MNGAPPQIDPTAPTEIADPLIGRVIAGKFLIETLLGTGAMGSVYRARQIALDKTIAVKILHRELAANKTFIARFHHEAKAASRLDHPNSIRILDFGQEPDGLLYISMDYLDGRDLLDVINQDWPLTTERIVDILSQALSALAVAHDLGILHRDLKPENIMVLSSHGDDEGSSDVVKVCDFGIAKMTDKEKDKSGPPDAGPKLSTVGVVVGTPAFMSPEHAKGEPIDARSDLYAIGVVLYQMMTRRLPFDAPSSISILYKHVNERPVPPSFETPGADARLEAICLKAMAKKPTERYASAREMRAALRALVDFDSRRSSGLGSGSSVPAVSTRTMAPPVDTRSPTLSLSSPPALSAFASNKRTRWKTATGVAILALAIGALALLRQRSLASSSTVALVTPIGAPAETKVETPQRGGDPTEHRMRGRSSAPPIAALETASSPAVGTAPHRQRHSKSSPSDETDRVPSPAHPETLASSMPHAPVVAPVPQSAAASPSDTSTARVEIGSAAGVRGTTATNVNKVMAPLAGKLTACYRSAPPQGGTTTDGTGTLHIETNEDGVITDVRLGARVGPAVQQCIVATVKGRKIPNVDTGSASADVPLAFKAK